MSVDLKIFLFPCIPYDLYFLLSVINFFRIVLFQNKLSFINIFRMVFVPNKE